MFLTFCWGEDLHLCLWQGRLCRWQGWGGAAKPPPSCSTSWWWCSSPPHQICLQFVSPFTNHQASFENWRAVTRGHQKCLGQPYAEIYITRCLFRMRSPSAWNQRESRITEEYEERKREVHCTRIKRGLGQILGRTSGRYDAATQATTSLSGRAPTHADRFSAVLTGRAGLLLLSVKFAFRLLAWMKTDKRLFGYNVLIADRFSAVLTGRVGLLLLSVKFAFRLRVDELAYSYFQ